MATSLSSNLKASIAWTYADGETAISETSNSGTISYSDTLTNGTSADNADLVYWTSGTLAASGTATIDLGSLTDNFGNSIDFERVKSIIIRNTTANTNDTEVLSVGGAGSNAWETWVGAAGDIVKVRPDGCFMLSCSGATGYAVGSNVNLLLTNDDGSNTLTYQVAVIGASA